MWGHELALIEWLEITGCVVTILPPGIRELEQNRLGSWHRVMNGPRTVDYCLYPILHVSILSPSPSALSPPRYPSSSLLPSPSPHHSPYLFYPSPLHPHSTLPHLSPSLSLPPPRYPSPSLFPFSFPHLSLYLFYPSPLLSIPTSLSLPLSFPPYLLLSPLYPSIYPVLPLTLPPSPLPPSFSFSHTVQSMNGS